MSVPIVTPDGLADQFIAYPAADVVRLGDRHLQAMIDRADMLLAVFEAAARHAAYLSARQHARQEVRRLNQARAIAVGELARRAADRAAFEVSCTCGPCVAAR